MEKKSSFKEILFVRCFNDEKVGKEPTELFSAMGQRLRRELTAGNRHGRFDEGLMR